jgi:hypothetical protein
MSTSLYNESNLSLDPSSLLIKYYYFPSGTAKTVILSTIDHVQQTPLNLLDRWRLWGAGDLGLTLSHWYNADSKRPSRTTAFIIHIKDAKTHPVVTPADPAAFAAALVGQGVRLVKALAEHKVLTRVGDGEEVNEEGEAVLAGDGQVGSGPRNEL